MIVKNDEVDPGRTATAAVSARPVAADESLGTALGRYRLERDLGAGAMGVVHAAFDPDLTVCAINFSSDWLDPAFPRALAGSPLAAPLACEHIGPSEIGRAHV